MAGFSISYDGSYAPTRLEYSMLGQQQANAIRERYISTAQARRDGAVPLSQLNASGAIGGIGAGGSASGGSALGTTGSTAQGGKLPGGGNLTTTLNAANTLDDLLKTLSAGGTIDQQLISTARVEEITRARQQQQGYSKDAAMSDADALIGRAIDAALKAAAPRITRASEGAGTSKSSQAALLNQNAATEGAIAGAAEGAKLAVNYGQISNQLAAVLDSLTKQDPNSPIALLASSISGSRGIIQPERDEPVQQPTTAAPQTPSSPSVPSLNPYSSGVGSYTPSYSTTQNAGGTNPTLIITPGNAGESEFNPYDDQAFDNASYQPYLDSGQYDDVFGP